MDHSELDVSHLLAERTKVTKGSRNPLGSLLLSGLSDLYL